MVKLSPHNPGFTGLWTDLTAEKTQLSLTEDSGSKSVADVFFTGLGGSCTGRSRKAGSWLGSCPLDSELRVGVGRWGFWACCRCGAG